jgi:hypothetical protein
MPSRIGATNNRPTDPVTPSSGNVFADIGLPEPDEEPTKAQLASHIRRILKRRPLAGTRDPPASVPSDYPPSAP